MYASVYDYYMVELQMRKGSELKAKKVVTIFSQDKFCDEFHKMTPYLFCV